MLFDQSFLIQSHTHAPIYFTTTLLITEEAKIDAMRQLIESSSLQVLQCLESVMDIAVVLEWNLSIL